MVSSGTICTKNKTSVCVSEKTGDVDTPKIIPNLMEEFLLGKFKKILTKTKIDMQNHGIDSRHSANYDKSLSTTVLELRYTFCHVILSLMYCKFFMQVFSAKLATP